MCIPTDMKGIRRRHVLQRNLHSDLSRSSILIYTLQEDFDTQAWASETAEALLPHSLPVFQRHRWLNSVKPMAEVCLLANVHNLLERAIPAWVARLKGKTVGQGTFTTWDVDSDDDYEGGGEGDAAAGSIVQRPGGEHFDRAAFNRRQRIDAKSFALSKPAGDLIICVLCSEPQVHLLRKLFTLRESSPAHPKTATLAKSTGYRDLSVIFSATMPRGVALIREVWEHAEKRRTGDAAMSQEGRMEEESEEEVGKGEEGGGGGGGGRGGEDEHKGQRPLGCLSESLGMSFGSLLEASWGVLGASWRSQGLLGAFWVPRGSLLGPLGGILGGSWRPLGASWAPSWGSLGAFLGALEAFLGPSWRPSIKL